MSQYPTELFRTSCGATAPLELNISGPAWADGERRVFEQPFVLVGRHERASLRLEDTAVSPRHAYLQQLGKKVFCVDLGSRTGIRWGKEFRPAGLLRPDQGVQIGPLTLELAMAAQAEGGPGDEVSAEWDPLQDRVNDPRLLPWITAERDNTVLAQMRMNRVMVLVGSSPACRIRLQAAGVSPYHCSLIRTPQGIWMIDLLSDTETRLNGQPVPWALLKDGDQLQVGTYLLRVGYRNVCTRPSPFSEIRTETPAQSPGDKSESERRLSQDQGILEPDGESVSSLPSPFPEIPSEPGNVPVQTLAVPRAEQSATEASSLVPALQAELNEVRERLRETEGFRQQLAESHAECIRLRDQVRVIEIQIAEAAGLQDRLQAAQARAHELESACAERDQWQSEAQTLQTRLASLLSEREQWQHRLEETQRRLDEERETARVAGVRLNEESSALQSLQAELAALNAEHSTVLQQLQETQDELAHAQDGARGFQAELDHARECLRDAETLRQQLADTQAKHDEICVGVLELEGRAASADSLREQLRAANAEAEHLRVQLRVAESRTAELEAIHADYDRLRDQARTLEMQVAEAAGLQVRLETVEARAHELEAACEERDQWQSEAQALQSRFASLLSEREQWQDRLETAQQQLDEEREAVRVAGVRLNQESSASQRVQAEFVILNAEHCAALQRLQEAQDELAHAHDGARGFQVELEQARERLRNAEVFKQELADSHGECVRLRDQVRVLEILVSEAASLQTRLEVAEARASELEAVCAERDGWQAEAQTLQARLASLCTEPEQFERLGADLHAAHLERDRMHTEQQASLHLLEQARSRIFDLERALSDATLAHERAVAEAHGGWELERQTLEARLEQERQANSEAAQAAVRNVQMRAEAAIREIQTRTAAEREEWRRRLEGAEAQIVWERGLFQEQGEQIRRQVAALQTERDRLAARLAQAESSLRAAEERSQNEAGNVAQQEQLRQLGIRDQVFADFGMQMRHLMAQAARTQGQEKPTEQSPARTP